MGQTVDAAGSGLVFQDGYGLDGTFASLTSSEQAALETDVQQAESDLSSEFTNSVTLNVDVEAVDVALVNGRGFIASNAGSDYRAVTLSSYFNALQSVATSSYQSSAVGDIENLTDLGGSNYVLLPEGYASMLGLSNAGTQVTDPSVQFTQGGSTYNLSSSVDDTLFINLAVVQTALEDQPANTPNDSIVGVIEHELTENGMGRISSLLTQSVSGGIGAVWEPAGFFRVNSAGQSDLTPNNGTAVFFSPEPGVTGPVSSLQFNNNTSGGDLGDWISNATSDPNLTDPFGAGDFNGANGTETSTLSPTDIDLLNALGWTIASGAGSAGAPTHVAPVVTAVSNISLIEGQSISASSLIASISNPSGDDITEDLFEDLGGGSGYFTVNGVRQADGEWITAGPSADVQYVAGSSPGSDTLSLGIYDATTNSDDFASGSTVATTIEVAESAPNILWRNSNGDVALWNANGSGGFTFQDLGVVGSNWQIDGAGDFNGGGKDGILWRNTNGDVALWNPNGSGGFTFQDLGVVDSSWQIEGTGDFNGGGKDGILWRNSNGDVALWNANGSGGFTFQDLGVVDSDWQIEGTGDFNGSGEDGVLWRNTNGDVALWNSNGAGGFSFEDLGVVDSDWQIAGTGDFNGSGEDGVLWRNTNGDVALWNSNGSGGFSFEDLGVVDSSWRIDGTGDFNDSGKDGVVWRNTSGDVALWNANASGGFTFQNLGVVASSWTILARLMHDGRF
jgi:hypothetical protein